MAKALDYTKLNDYRKVHIGGAVLGGPAPNQGKKKQKVKTPKVPKIIKPLRGQDRRRVEIKTLQKNKRRNENQEKRLQCLLKLEGK